METRLRVELFGGLRILRGDQIITRFSTHKTGALLAYLAFFGRHAHPRERLITLLWPDCEPDAGRNRLSTSLSSLRHQLEPPGISAGTVLLADRASVRLNPEAIRTDTAAFDAAFQAARKAGSDLPRLQYWTEAVERYGGELLPGYFEEWILPQQQEYAARYFEALRHLTDGLAKAGRIAQALEYARQAVRVEPYHDDAHLVLMRLLHADGQSGAAVRHYHTMERLLREQLDESPSTAARHLAQQPVSTLPASLPEIALPRPTPTLEATTDFSVLPTGTVALLLTDLVPLGAESAADGVATVPADYPGRCRRLANMHGGKEQKRTESGGVELVFARASDALMCALAMQHLLTTLSSSEAAPTLSVRAALELGEISSKEGDGYRTLHDRAARLLTAGHGGQIVCSESIAVVLRRNLESGLQLNDLGSYRFPGVLTPERIFSVETSGRLPRSFPPLKAVYAYFGHLPLQVTRFFGREKEIERLVQMLAEAPPVSARLVTLTGPGGSGKTRLAVEMAARFVERMQGAVWFVPLVEVRGGQGVLEGVRDALGLPRSSDATPIDQIAGMLSEQPGLLILDNFEQVIEAGSDRVRQLQERLPTLRLLVTSRRTLNLVGEQEFAVPPMSTPDGVETPERLVLCESVKLFVDRAQAVRPDFQVTASNAAAISELCERLEGIPLALELAASRAQALTPAQMLGQLEHRFDLLVSRRRDIAARHRTLRAALDWSYQSLAPELQAFFGRLSVFRGGWTTEAAEAVCDARNFRTIGSAPDALALLRECSLILSEEVGEQMRFRMLETLREYAGEKLTAGKEDAHLERAHAHYFFLLEETATQRLHGPDQVAWFQRLEAEHDNFRAALQWGLTTTEAPVRPRGKDSPDPLNRGNSAFTPLDPETLTPAEVALHLANGLASFWWTRGYLREGREWVEKILKLDAVQAPTEARASLLRSAGTLAEMLGDYVAAHTYLEEGIALARALGDSSQLLSLLANLGILLKQERDYARADLLLGEALALAEHLQNKMVKASVLNTLGQIAFYQGDPAKARILLENGMQLDREQENLQNISAMLCNLAILARMQEDYVGAQSYLQECLEACRSLGDQRLGLHAFETLAGVLFGQEQFAEGTRIFGAAQALRAATGIPVPPHDQEEADREIARGRAGLGPDDFEAALASGRGLNWESALAYAQQILRG